MSSDHEGPAPAVTRDAFFGGRIHLTQPVRGHRSGSDAVLLAAAAPCRPTRLCYDIGAGVGAVGLGIAALRPVDEVVLVERDSAAVALAWSNVDAFDGSVRLSVAQCDVLDRAALRSALPRSADLVVTNPPFHAAGRGRPSPYPARRAARVLDDGFGLADWLSACLDRLADGGTLVAIAATPTLPEILGSLAGTACGITVKAVQPGRVAPAHRLLVRAEKGSRKPFALAAPLILHGADGRFTPEADQIHRGVAALAW